MNSSYTSKSTKPLFRGTQIVWYALSVLEIILAFRFMLKLTGANPSAGFTTFIYSISWPFTAPFLSVFPSSRVSGSIFEWTTILAMLVYWLVAYGIIRIFLMSKTVSTGEAAVELQKQEE